MGDFPRVRLAVVGLLIVSLLVTLLARLWYLQVLSGEEAQELAERTSVRSIHHEAPRGFIFDRHGEALAANRTALTVALDVSLLPEEGRDEIVRELAAVLEMEEARLREVVEDPRLGHHTPRPIAVDVPKDTVIYLREHRDRFPGVTDMEIPVREYPHESLAAHLVGHIGEVNAEELERYGDDYRRGETIGKLGVERAYESWLRGKPGIERIAVNVRGDRVQRLATSAPERGWDAVLTIDAHLQEAAEESLERAKVLGRRLYDPNTGESLNAPGGAVVALDPQSGEVLAMASNPSFDPNIFVGSAPSEELERINDPEEHFPMLNRAVGSAFSPGSTFKPITAAAGWDAGLVSEERTFTCPGFLRVGDRVFNDWQPDGHGTVGLETSLAHSCNITYVQLGVEMHAQAREGSEHLQSTARSFGFGTPTGVDLMGERDGLVPDAAWKEERFSDAEPHDRNWFAGDSANLAIGQGFLQVTPLQLAVAYGAIANGGTIYRPHVLKCVAKLDISRPTAADDACSGGRVPESASPTVLNRLDVPPEGLAEITEGMVGTQRGEGTAASAFEGFPLEEIAVAGKTGTAEMQPRQNFSWYAAVAPAEKPEIAVVGLLEEGGTGSEIAAPMVRRVLERYFGIPERDLEPGTRAD